MGRFCLKLLYFAIAWFPLQIAWNAVLDWSGSQLATQFGLKSPAVSEVYTIFVEIGPPLLAAAVAFYCYHLWWSRKATRVLSSPQDTPSESAEVFRAKAELAKQERLRHKQEILERSVMRNGIANSKMPVPDWPIQELFFHLRPSLRTGEDLDYEATALAIKDKLSIGQMDIWGRTITFHGEDRPFRKISQTYWQKADFTYAFFMPGGSDEPHTRPDQDSGLPEYYNLQVNRSQALTIWREPLVEKQDKWTWPALTKIEIDCVYTNLKEKGGQHSVHIACDNAQCEKLADSFSTIFKRLAWPHHVGSGLMDAQGARGLLLTPDNETSRAIKSAIELNTGLDIEILTKTKDSGGSSKSMLIIGSRD